MALSEAKFPAETLISLSARKELSTAHRFVRPDVGERVGEVERWLLHVAVDLLAEGLEPDGRRGHDAQVGAESSFRHWICLVPQQSLEVFLWIGWVVLFRVHPHHPVIACTDRHIHISHLCHGTSNNSALKPKGNWKLVWEVNLDDLQPITTEDFMWLSWVIVKRHSFHKRLTIHTFR